MSRETLQQPVLIHDGCLYTTHVQHPSHYRRRRNKVWSRNRSKHGSYFVRPTSLSTYCQLVKFKLSYLRSALPHVSLARSLHARRTLRTLFVKSNSFEVTISFTNIDAIMYRSMWDGRYILTIAAIVESKSYISLNGFTSQYPDFRPSVYHLGAIWGIFPPHNRTPRPHEHVIPWLSCSKQATLPLFHCNYPIDVGDPKLRSWGIVRSRSRKPTWTISPRLPFLHPDNPPLQVLSKIVMTRVFGDDADQPLQKLVRKCQRKARRL